MKRFSIVAVLILAAGTVAMAERYSGSQGSVIKIEGTSTLHAWTMETSQIKGEITAPTAEIWNAGSKAVVSIPIASIKSEHSKMDKLMAEALKAKTHPEIRFELVDAVAQNANANGFTVKTRGRLTIAGVTKDVTMDVRGQKTADGRFALTGEAPIRMTSFGIKPPTAMMNTIRTGDDVKVSFRWIVQPSN